MTHNPAVDSPAALVSPCWRRGRWLPRPGNRQPSMQDWLARMGWPHVSMDAVCAGYYAEVSVDQAVSERPEQADGVRAALAPVRNLALLLPSPDPEESVRILTKPRAHPWALTGTDIL
jgi:hypothetical protein